MRKLILFLALLLFYGGNSFAQVTQVKGQVLDQEDGSPIIGASVMVEGMPGKGASTDADGRFTITGLNAQHQKLKVTYIGYAPQTVVAKPHVTVYLSSKTEMLDEVLVVAFGKQKREAFTGSATVVNSEQITQQQVNNPVSALNGKVAGMLMTDDNSVSASGSPVIRVRGISSINASNSPLIVLDGLPFNGYINDINPADIENITVLKDAASNALYGARGANGVIMITTKNAQRGRTKVTLDAKWGVNTDGRVMYDVIDNPGEYYEAHYQAMRNYYIYRQQMSPSQAHIEANSVLAKDSSVGGLGYMAYSVPEGQYLIGTNGKLNPAASLGNRVAYGDQIYTIYPDNWYKSGLRHGLRQEYNLNLNGGSERFSFMATLGYLENQGLSYGSEMKRITTRLKTTYQAYDWLKVGVNAGYTNTNSHSMNNVFSTQYGIAPIYPLYVRDGAGNIMHDTHGKVYDYGYYTMGLVRPVYIDENAIQNDLLDKSFNSVNAFNISGYATADFLKNFHFTANGSVYITENRMGSSYNPYFGYNVNSGGNTYREHYRTTDFNVQQLLNYNKTFGKHSIDALLGHEYSRWQQTYLYGYKSNLANYDKNTELGGAIIDGGNFSSVDHYNVEGFFGRAQYDYDTKYFASASYRRDGSSHFHPKHRWGNFWSIGGAWIVSKEEWFPKNPVLNMLKYKISYGEQGNDGIGSYRYTDQYNIVNSNDDVAYSFKSKGNETISWEKNGNFNTGIEFELFNGRLSGGLDYYYRKTSDMLMLLSTPYEIGYSSYYDNIGDMTNKGIELNLNADLLTLPNFTWNVGLNLAWQVNRITYIPKEKAGLNVDGYQGYSDGSYFYGIGLPIYTMYVKRYAGVKEGDPLVDSEAGKAMYYVRQKDGSLTTTTTYSKGSYFVCGDPNPDVFGGFNTSFKFYGVDIAAQFVYSIGGEKFDNAYRSLMSNPTTKGTGTAYHRDLLDGWTPENNTSNIPMFAYRDEEAAYLSDRFLQDASFLTFRNLSIGYTFPKSLISKIKMQKLRVYGVCENVAYWTKRKGFDPRGSLYSGSFGANSPMRTISAGLQVEF